jgi:hypothetical protein
VAVVFIGIYVFVEPYCKTPTSLSYVSLLAVEACECVHTRSGIFVFGLLFMCQCVVDRVRNAICRLVCLNVLVMKVVSFPT